MTGSKVKPSKVDTYILRAHTALYELLLIKTNPISHVSKPLLEEAILHMGINSPFSQIYDLMFGVVSHFRR